MRSTALACALAVTVAACGGKQGSTAELPASSDDDDGPFTAKAGFEPTAFTVDVRGEGRPVIFIPGLGCPGAMWNDTAERLDDVVDGGIEAHILTLSGFAGTDPIRPPLAAKTRKELVRYIRSRKLDRPIVVGHSMGGFITYWLATTSSNALGGIVVVDAGPALGSADDDDARRLRNMWAQAGDDELPVQIRTVYSWMIRDVKKLEPYFDDIVKSDRQTIGDAIYEMVKTDVRDKLPAIEVPTLLVLADGSLQGSYRKMAAPIPDHKVVVVPKARHFVMLDAPEQFAKVVGAFIIATGE
jgi:pimeloyl-ACP methyl ester carboxylesterase